LKKEEQIVGHDAAHPPRRNRLHEERQQPAMEDVRTSLGPGLPEFAPGST
jgi:hypothetical protein